VDDKQLHVAAADHLAKKNYVEAFRIYEQLASKGYGECQVYVGWMLHEGIGVVSNRAQALEHFRQAAQQGHPKGMFYVGRALTAESKHSDAFFWYQNAAVNGYMPAVYRLGIAYLDGLGVPINRSLGISSLRRAASSGHILAKRELALRSIRGELGVLNIPKGIWLFIEMLFSASRVALRKGIGEEFYG